MTEEQWGPSLTSGEMVRASGLSIKALRLYDANGLLVPAQVDARTGYRSYAPEQVERGRSLALLRRLDVPLSRVPEMLDADPHDVRDVLLGWWDERQRELADQRATAEALARRLAAPGAAARRGEASVPDPAPAAGTGPVRWREVPACTVATITSAATQGDLVPTFTADLITLRAHVAASDAEGGTAHWVVFHEPVGREVPGRVETCVPYRGTLAPAGRIVLREDPARTEAYVAVPSRDCRFPRIVDYHDALRGVAALDRAGRTPSPHLAGGPAHRLDADDTEAAPTREVYPVAWTDEPDVVVAVVAVTVSRTPEPPRGEPSEERPRRS